MENKPVNRNFNTMSKDEKKIVIGMLIFNITVFIMVVCCFMWFLFLIIDQFENSINGTSPLNLKLIFGTILLFISILKLKMLYELTISSASDMFHKMNDIHENTDKEMKSIELEYKNKKEKKQEP